MRDKIEVATDFYGRKQLYYRLDKGKIIAISSEIKTLIRKGDKPDNYYLSTVARFGYFFGGNNTQVEDIKKFPRGKVFRLSLGDSEEILNNPFREIKPMKYFGKKISYSFLRILIKDAVEKQLTNNTSVAVLYSGGIDSSILLYHLHELKANTEIFTINNGEDLLFAKRYADELGMKIKIIPYQEENYWEIQKWNELGVDLGSFSLDYSLFKAVRDKGYKMCLTGDGADEVFSGYKRNKEFDFQQNDIFNELINYHFPRLEQTAIAHNIEYRSPFTADYVIDAGLKIPYKDRIDKKFLRDSYRGLIPDWIIDRPKQPLKVEKIKIDPIKERIKLSNWMKKNFIKSWL